jgi:Winged helix-turn-helix DNA-binding
MKSNGSGCFYSSLLGTRTQTATHGMDDPPDKERREIEERLSELRPLLEEYRCLKDVMAALGPVKESRAGVPSSGKRVARSVGPSASGGDGAGGDVVARVLSVVQAHPGITIPELTTKLNPKPRAVYRILQELKREGRVAKGGRGWLVPDGSRPRGAPRAARRRS